MAELSPAVLNVVNKSLEQFDDIMPNDVVAKALLGVATAIHALTLQLAENSERTQSVDAHVETEQ